MSVVNILFTFTSFMKKNLSYAIELYCENDSTVAVDLDPLN